MKSFKPLIEYFKQYKWQFILGLALFVIVDIVQLFIPRVIKYAIDDITLGKVSPSHLIRYALWIVGLSGVVALFRFFWRYYIMGTVRKIEEKLRNRLFSHLQILELKFYREHKIGDLMAHFTNDIETISRTLRMGIIIVVDIVMLGILSFVFMYIISPRLTIYAIIPLPLISFIVFKFGRIIHHRSERVQEAFSSLTAQARENIDGIRVIKSYNQEGGEIQKFKQKAQDYVDKNISLLKTRSTFQPIIFFLASITNGIVLWLGGREAILHHISMGDFVAFYSYLGMIIWPMVGVGMLVDLIQRGAASMDRINVLLNTTPEDREQKTEDREQSTEDREQKTWEIEFRNLSFSYNSTPVLKNIDLILKSGESLGIVGHIGSGKSTLVSMLPRLFEPTEGEIKIDGIALQTIPLSTLRKNITLVPQDTFLFSATIRENIAFGCPDIADSEIHRVAKMTKIYDEIMKFTNGFNEIVGERGITLSGGQRQRIAIARAIITKPKIIILDNALSSIDTEKEVEIIQNLQNEFSHCILIIISHRIRSIMGLNRIIVLKEGKIVENGTHTELLSQQNDYFKLFNSQEIEL
ncbi:MAG: ABC transporter ATP-binding protein [Candidatus Stahlbacteria bacterium]|nr:ABC transporter ATP-binding protein [Candidatus Stahlbacteria bacterium]